jgi:UDP-glucose 4-epimerase
MKALVTGGAGFIGSNLVDRLIQKNIQVLVIDNLSTGNLTNINPLAKFVEMDINESKLINVFEDFQPEYIFHLAAQVSVSNSVKNPINDNEINTRGTINLLEACINTASVKKIIYSSSAAVYGVPEFLPISENHNINPISPYGISKYSPEKYIQYYSNSFEIDYTILRYSNVYGPRQVAEGEGGVISIFLKNIVEGNEIVIYGDGEQTRDFIFVDDVVEANIQSINNGSNQIINVSTGESISLNELVTELKKLSTYKIGVSYIEGKSGDIKHSCLNNGLLNKTLNVNPKFSLEDGLVKTMRHFMHIQQNIT